MALHRLEPPGAFPVKPGLIGVLVWVYFSSIIDLFGAELTQAWATEHGRRGPPIECGMIRAICVKLTAMLQVMNRP